ncbi:DNA/RNA nuclease SfsA [Pyrobaculum neutrophilum]|uniref:Sugar fermentation stimulation protein homolog n=1 Tax=Pyrobaculum neutrophilum (strain DSM 2338 / JCM 9278 / NBRC 100436 / V24Sta) TaxID=444157 RepID=SFSA_PYRNV|nr:DNA/RNA nuclease SfsA [Pyrobaculum neutrophilum]B1Y8T9.1 RecName: Full=Sugar fermentation stimulation protein homolog [Pyrobaculum neutrophilum V24Sta]ACB40168.1 sugar fermentation stimulation protein [Pyrobaculum neutrophilum V24Sta]
MAHVCLPLDEPDARGVFKRRLNRFVGVAEIGGADELVHIHDPGRLAELLYPGSVIWARRKKTGKTRYYLTAVELADELVFVDSAKHNKIASWLIESGVLLPGYRVERHEPAYGKGRFDLLLRGPKGEKALVEVKGVTLEVGGRALFPDAPTTRGARHMEELARAAADGFEAHVVFLVLRKKAAVFSPNWEMDRRFAEALARAYKSGVYVHAVKLETSRWCLKYVEKLPIDLQL